MEDGHVGREVPAAHYDFQVRFQVEESATYGSLTAFAYALTVALAPRARVYA